MFDNPVLRGIFILIGLTLVAIGSCGAMEKISNEGWNGPSSKPGAVHRR